MNWALINLFSLGAAWFMEIDFGNLDWVKWPTTMGFGTIIYLIYNFYNAKKTHVRSDFESASIELKEIISMLKEDNESLRAENKELRSQINKE